MKTTSIKFFWNGIRVNNSKKIIKVFYSLDNNVEHTPSVSISARDYDHLPTDIFVVQNDTDYYTDYFDSDRAELTPEHPLYKYARAAALKSAIRGEPEYIAKLRAHLGKPDNFYYNSRLAEIESREKRLAQYTAELADLPQGHPTAADLATVEKMNTAAESARIAAEQAAEQAYREKIFAERINGCAYIKEIAKQYPIIDGAPYVEIPFSEHPAFYNWNEQNPLILSVAAAEIILSHFDEQRFSENEAENVGGYDKTDFIIYYKRNGKAETYEGRYDLGDHDGGMIEHIRSFGRMYIEQGSHGYPNEEDKTKGLQIVEFSNWLESFTKNGYIFYVELAPWVQKSLKQQQMHQSQEIQNIFDYVEILTDEQLEMAIMNISPNDKEKLDVARFFLQQLYARNRDYALQVFRKWKQCK